MDRKKLLREKRKHSHGTESARLRRNNRRCWPERQHFRSLHVAAPLRSFPSSEIGVLQLVRRRARPEGPRRDGHRREITFPCSRWLRSGSVLQAVGGSCPRWDPKSG